MKVVIFLYLKKLTLKIRHFWWKDSRKRCLYIHTMIFIIVEIWHRPWFEVLHCYSLIKTCFNIADNHIQAPKYQVLQEIKKNKHNVTIMFIRLIFIVWKKKETEKWQKQLNTKIWVVELDNYHVITGTECCSIPWCCLFRREYQSIL